MARVLEKLHNSKELLLIFWFGLEAPHRGGRGWLIKADEGIDGSDDVRCTASPGAA